MNVRQQIQRVGIQPLHRVDIGLEEGESLHLEFQTQNFFVVEIPAVKDFRALVDYRIRQAVVERANDAHQRVVQLQPLKQLHVSGFVKALLTAGDDVHQHLIGANAMAHHQIPQQARMGFFMVKRIFSLPAEVQGGRQNPIEIFRHQLTFIAGNDGHEAPLLMHAQFQRTADFYIAEGVFHLVAVPVRGLRRNHSLIYGRIHMESVEKVQHLLILQSMLLFIGNALVQAAAAKAIQLTFFKILHICHRTPFCIR